MSEENGTPVAATTIVRRFEPKVGALVRAAEALVVTNDEEDQLAADALAKVRGMLKEAEGEKKKITDPMNQALKAVRALFEKVLGPLAVADGVIDHKLGNYRIEKRRKFEAEQRRIQEENEAIAEKEKQRLLDKAKAAEEQGKTDKAQDLRAQAEFSAAGLFGVEEKLQVSTTTKLKNGATRMVTGSFDIEVSVVNPMAVLHQIINGNIPIGAVEFKLGELKRHVKAYQLKEVPGLAIREVYNTQVRK